MYEKRTYRDLIKAGDLVSFGVSVKETDLWICADRLLENEARENVLKVRGYIESYIHSHPGFIETLEPWAVNEFAPLVVKEMAEAGSRSGVGPMAAVAGALAESVGKELLAYSNEVIVENGGDIFIRLNRPFTYSIFAGKSPLSMRFGIHLDGSGMPLAVCTSSATIGHSFSLGKADAVCVVSDSCAVADAAATSICNQVTSEKEIQSAIDFGNCIEGVSGIVVIAYGKMGIWGNVEIRPL